MVKNKFDRRIFLPLFVSAILIFIFNALGLKPFLASLVLCIFGWLSLIDIRIAIFSVSFLMPFLPNALSMLGFLGVSMVYFMKRLFLKEDRIKYDIFSAVIVLYLIIITLQTILSVNVKGSMRDFGLHIAGMLYVFTVVNSIETKKDLNTLITVIIFSVTLVALIGVVQYFTGAEIRREWLDTKNNPDIRVRVYSVFGNPNTLAEYLVMFTPISIAMFWHTKSMKKKFVFAICSATMLFALVCTLSRGGWVGIAVAAFVFCILVDKRLLLLAVPIVFIGLLVLPDTVINRILSIGNFSDSSNSHRFEIWKITRKVIRDNKIAGVGFGYIPFKQVYENYSRTVNAYHAHNTFLETLAEIGITGFLVFISMLFVFIKYPIKILIKRTENLKEDTYFKYVAVGTVSGIIGVFFHGLVENVLYLPKIIFSFWTLVAISFAALEIVKDTSKVLLKGEDSYKIVGRVE